MSSSPSPCLRHPYPGSVGYRGGGGEAGSISWGVSGEMGDSRRGFRRQVGSMEGLAGQEEEEDQRIRRDQRIGEEVASVEGTGGVSGI